MNRTWALAAFSKKSMAEIDYSKAKPNRFANAAGKRRVAIVLDEYVAEIFETTESVNKALRAFIEAMPSSSGRREV